MRLYIADMLRAQKKHISFHTPGHKRAGADITELSYSDNLYAPHGVLACAERDVARILGAAKSFLLTDGSTSGVYSMLFAVRKAGARRVAAPVFSHPSVAHACEALGMTLVPIPQTTRYGVPVQPSAEAAGEALAQADALLLTSPDYYGFFAPLPAAKAAAEAAGKPLLVDGAHGSHLHGTPLHAGAYADLWVDGVHKSLPALTQGAVVSANAAWAERLGESVRYFRTTSPSYPILASVEYAVKYPIADAGEAERFKAEAGALPNDDWTKVLIPFGARCAEAQAYLEAHGVYPELNDGNYLMFYLSPCTKRAELKKLRRLLAQMPRGTVAEDAPAGAIPIYSEGL